MSPWMETTGMDVDPFRLAGRAARTRHGGGNTAVSTPLVGGPLRHRLCRPGGHARVARHHRRVPPGSWFRSSWQAGARFLPFPDPKPPSSPQRITIDDVSSSTNGAAALTRIRLAALLSFVVWAWLAGVTLLLARFAGGCWRVHRLRVASLARSHVAVAVVERATGSAAPIEGRFPGRGIEARRCADRHWMDSSGDPSACRGPDQPGPGPDRSHPCARTGPHPSPRLRRQPVAEPLPKHSCSTTRAVWWISAQVREAREQCCDDVAVEVCGEPTAYAAALVELASWRTRQIALSVAATDGPLLARVRRLLRVPETLNLGPAAGW